MSRKKVDNRIRVLIENSVALRHRSMFVVVGDKAKDQVSSQPRGSFVATANTIAFNSSSSHRKKRMRQLQKKLKSGTLDTKDDPFELFVAATTIRYCYYSETHKILGSTYGMCVLQDFEALTPNLLARTIETVEGGGMVVFLLKSMASLKQLYTLTMDIHARYRTEAHNDVVGRFNERFLLSLGDCSHCMVIDDQLNLLPVSSHMLKLEPVRAKTKEESMTPEQLDLQALKHSLADTQPVGVLVECAKTLDQAKALLQFVEAISEKTLRTTVALTASRGRGKSAALGMAIAAAVAFGYSNIFVTSPSPENLKTVFEFVLKGFDALHYVEHEDYEVIQSTNPEFNEAVVRVNIFHEHRQTIQYIHPADSHKLEQAELVCIDEAAAIPLPLVKNLLGPYLVFMASTINGYEGTGRSLSLKLIDQLRQQSSVTGVSASSSGGASFAGRTLREVTLEEPIRYSAGDPVERWLHGLLCLDASSIRRVGVGCPPPQDCELYHVNRDTLFSYHKASEEFLHRLMALYVASHYKNTPNDLQLLSDAPRPPRLCPPWARGPFHVLPARDPVCAAAQFVYVDVSSCDLTRQFADNNFASLSGARVVRIATHPDFQSMGYGSRALSLLSDYYEGRFPSLSEEADRDQSGVVNVALDNDEEGEDGGLLMEGGGATGQAAPAVDELDGAEAQRGWTKPGRGIWNDGKLFKVAPHGSCGFWKKAGYLPVYLRQTENELTGEHSAIMLKALASSSSGSSDWLKAYTIDFRGRFASLLSYQFRQFKPVVALSVLHTASCFDTRSACAYEELTRVLSQQDLKRLDLYSRNMADHHLITDLLPTLAKLYFWSKVPFNLSAVQASILLGMGLQHKTVEVLEKELGLPSSQIMGLFNRSVRKFSSHFTEVVEGVVGRGIPLPTDAGMAPLEHTVDQELSEEVKAFKKKQLDLKEQLETADLEQYSVSGKEVDWAGVTTDKPGIISMARTGHKRLPTKPSHKEKEGKAKRKKQKH
eukprot:Em0003g317a